MGRLQTGHAFNFILYFYFKIALKMDDLADVEKISSN